MHANIILQNNCLTVSGELNFLTVGQLFASSLPLISSQSELNFDLSQVVSSNSAGLALLLEWMKHARQQNKKITFNALPKQLESILKISGVSGLIDSGVARVSAANPGILSAY